jgi:hypothetical protein
LVTPEQGIERFIELDLEIFGFDKSHVLFHPIKDWSEEDGARSE